MEKIINVCTILGNFVGRDHFGYLVGDGRMILKQILNILWRLELD
jgi:hypothetical protein